MMPVSYFNAGTPAERTRVSLGAVLLAALLLFAAAAPADEADDDPATFAERIEGRTSIRGLFDLYPGDDGRVLASLPPGADDGTLLRFIHALRLTRGLGSNPLGLDRGWGNSGRILRFRRIGPRVLLEAENHRYRAETSNVLEQNAVAESFARSFLWTTDVLAESPEGRILIDLSGFLTQDGLGLGQRLSSDGGAFELDRERSMPDASSVLAFPDNVEIDAWMTFSGTLPGAQIRATAADPHHVTLVQHHSFVRLPDDGYRVRQADPRSGSFEQAFRDFAAPLDEPILRSHAVRQRLQYVEAGKPESGIAEPIVFYIDPGAPEAIRDALIDGASWWADAFEAAGFPGGYRVELLPEDVHPLDIRYNVVQWVHRQTRGWSYGGGIIDPRTGELIKGHVILGSQRVRQDRMIFEGLAGTAATGTGQDDDPVQLSLDRIRQLSAHEIGHALGFGHNFAASSLGRASVMDYPAPWIDVRDGALDFSRAYDRGIGEWDRVSARWLYAEFPPDVDEEAALDSILDQAFEQGLLYIADEHGRSVSGAHPRASVWDNGDDAVTELERAVAVRALALANFGADRIAEGRPLTELHRVLVPIYLFHRYQVDAAAKLLAGTEFSYGKRGATYRPPAPVPAAQQQRALHALLSTLEPGFLDLPDAVLAVLPPGTRGFGFVDAPPETLSGRTGPIFDRFMAAETAADLTLKALFDSQRAERLLHQHTLDRDLPSLASVLEAAERQLMDNLRGAGHADHRVIAQRVVTRYVAALIAMDSATASPEVRAGARAALAGLPDALPRRQDAAWSAWLKQQVAQHLDRPAPPLEAGSRGPTIPPGSPIGAATTSPQDRFGPGPGSGTTAIGTSASGPVFVEERCWHCR